MKTYEERRKILDEKLAQAEKKLEQLEHKKKRLIRDGQRHEKALNDYRRRERTHFLIMIGARVVKGIGEIEESDLEHIEEFFSKARTADGKNLGEYLASRKEKNQADLP